MIRRGHFLNERLVRRCFTQVIYGITTSDADSRAAEIARLEEEERRINEMIAEKETFQAL